MATVALRSPFEKVGGLFYFGRMLDKIRLHAKGELPADYHENLGKGFDEKCVTFLRINYDQLVEHVKRSGSDEEILQWCFSVGRKPSDNDVYIWNEFMRKRGWHDEVSEMLESEKKREAMLSRSEIQTMFQFMDADEGRLVNDNHMKASRVRKRIAIPAREWPARPEDRDSPDASKSVQPINRTAA